MADNFIAEGGAPRAAISNGIRDTFFTIAVIALIASFLATGAAWFYARYLTNSTVALKDEAARLEGDLRPDILNQILALDKKLSSLSALLKGHPFSSNIFIFLQQNTIPQVHFSVFSYSADGRKIDLTGEATTYSALANQVRAFEALSRYVERVDFGGLSVNEKGFISFKMGITFKDSLIHTANLQ